MSKPQQQDLTTALKVLNGLSRPTRNPVTDRFGFDRLWGESTWNPDRGYAPIHAGVDYSTRTDPNIYAPYSGYTYGHKVEGHVGSVTYLRPVYRGEALTNVMLVFMHCEPTESHWQWVSQGEPFTTHAGYGVGAPHLHFEIDTEPEVFDALFQQGTLTDAPVTPSEITQKARRENLDPAEVISRVEQQKHRWGIEFLGHNGIIRYSLPSYRHSRYSQVGKARTAVLPPDVFYQ